MFEIDGLLEGQLSRRHFENILCEAQQKQFACEIEAAQQQDKTISPLRTLVTAILHFVMN